MKYVYIAILREPQKIFFEKQFGHRDKNTLMTLNFKKNKDMRY